MGIAWRGGPGRGILEPDLGPQAARASFLNGLCAPDAGLPRTNIQTSFERNEGSSEAKRHDSPAEATHVERGAAVSPRTAKRSKCLVGVFQVLERTFCYRTASWQELNHPDPGFRESTYPMPAISFQGGMR